MQKLIEWKDSKYRKPLLLTGARQVGKTFLLKEFGKKEFQNTVYLSFDTEKDRFIDIFTGSIHPVDIIQKIELTLGVKITPEDTLLIFDEIQEIPEAITALKYFSEDAPEYHIAASGSLLGITLAKHASFPVGKVDMLTLEPLDFEEFLMATDNERFTRIIADSSLIASFSDKLELLFRQYLVVGGMPEVVSHFIENHDYNEVDRIQESILLAYLHDISKHTDKNTAVRIHQVWQSLPTQFAKRNEKFMFGLIRDGARAREYELAIEWLIDAHIVRRISRVSSGNKLPLKAYIDQRAFKLYFLDTGLFRHLSGLSSEVVANNDSLFAEFGGFLAEQFVLQQLNHQNDFYYWSSDASAEVDFVTEIMSHIIPIEVKSGENVKAKSLKVYREKYSPALSLRFSLKNLEYNDGLLNIPIYFAGFADKLSQKYL